MPENLVLYPLKYVGQVPTLLCVNEVKFSQKAEKICLVSQAYTGIFFPNGNSDLK